MLAGLFIVATIFIVVSWLVQMNQRQGKLAVNIKIIPSSAKVFIDDKPIGTRSGEIYVTPGEHTIKISNDGFKSHENTFHAREWYTPGQYVGLAPETEEATKWYNKNRKKYKEIELAIYRESQEYGKNFNERWPIVKILPLKDPYFTISYRLMQESGDIYLTVKGTSPRYREFAIKHLRKQGFEPTDYNIEFLGYENPLETKEASRE